MALQIEICKGRQHPAGEDRIGLGAALDAGAGQGEVGKGRHRRRGEWLRRRLFGGEDRQKRQASASGVAGNDNPLGPLRDKAPIGRRGVLDGGGKGMFGREPIIRQKRVRAGSLGDLAGEVGPCARRANDVAAAVDIEHTRPWFGAVRPRPPAGDAADRSRFEPHIDGGGRRGEHGVEHRPRLRTEDLALMGRSGVAHRRNGGSVLRRQGVKDIHDGLLCRSDGGVGKGMRGLGAAGEAGARSWRT